MELRIVKMAVVSGGTTLIDNGALDSAVPTGSLTLLSTQTASSSANISFTSGIDSTYKEYIFKFINIHPSANGNQFQFNMTTDGTNYNVTKTSTQFYSVHKEDDSNQGLSYGTSYDLAQSTGFQALTDSTSNDDDGSTSGELFIFSPSSTTFVKHFIATTNSLFSGGTYSWQQFTAGYGNTTSAVTGVQFKYSSGNIDSGTIKMYGVK
tara:strand:+ start:1577 stop:2200 length:624 start_codon:yes stop_codon:yes gene_type:complete